MQVRCHAACRTTAEQDFFRVAKAVILLELAYQRIQVGFASKVQRRVGAVFPMCWTERNNTKQTKMIIIMLTSSYRKSYRKAPSAWIEGNTCLPTRENAVGDNCLPTRENTGCISLPSISFSGSTASVVSRADSLLHLTTFSVSTASVFSQAQRRRKRCVFFFVFWFFLCLQRYIKLTKCKLKVWLHFPQTMRRRNTRTVRGGNWQMLD